jgi:hypothetical protein
MQYVAYYLVPNLWKIDGAQRSGADCLQAGPAQDGVCHGPDQASPASLRASRTVKFCWAARRLAKVQRLGLRLASEQLEDLGIHEFWCFCVMNKSNNTVINVTFPGKTNTEF